MNHLLKSPFSYHPKSGFISVPIPTEKRGQLPQEWAPELTKLLMGDPQAVEEFEASVRLFREFVDQTVTDHPGKSRFYDDE
jgi:hypothetical protein